MRVLTPGARLRSILNPFDLVVLAGAAVNVVLVLLLLGYWFVHG